MTNLEIRKMKKMLFVSFVKNLVFFVVLYFLYHQEHQEDTKHTKSFHIITPDSELPTKDSRLYTFTSFHFPFLK
jgi:Ca2+/Na+ antiporter